MLRSMLDDQAVTFRNLAPGSILNVPARAVLQTGARTVTVVGPTNLEEEAAQVHQEFWPKHLGKA